MTSPLLSEQQGAYQHSRATLHAVVVSQWRALWVCRQPVLEMLGAVCSVLNDSPTYVIVIYYIRICFILECCDTWLCVTFAGVYYVKRVAYVGAMSVHPSISVSV